MNTETRTLTRAIVRDRWGIKRGEFHSNKKNAETWGADKIASLDSLHPAHKPHSVVYTYGDPGQSAKAIERKPGAAPLPVAVRTMIALAAEIHKADHAELNGAVLYLERCYGRASVSIDDGGRPVLTFDPGSLESFDLVTTPGDECPDYFEPRTDWALTISPTE